MDVTVRKISGVASIIQSGLYVAAVCAVARTPFAAMLGEDLAVAARISMEAYAANPLPGTVMGLSFLFLGLIGLVAVAPATGRFFGEDEAAWLFIGRRIGSLCLALITVYYGYVLCSVPERAAAFLALDGPGRELASLNLATLEPPAWLSWFMFFGMGLWVAAVGIASLKGKAMPKAFAAVCAVKTMGFWLAHFGIVTGRARFAIAGAVVGGLIGGPIYHAWLGIAMVRSGAGRK